jgi:hypothetical protein
MVCTDMRSQKHYYTWPFQVLIESGPGSLAAGYVRARSLQDSINLALQRRRIAEFAESKGWEFASWYEEPGENGGTEQTPVFAQILSDASSQSFRSCCARRVGTGRELLAVLYRWIT